jgi:hypothetical protein
MLQPEVQQHSAALWQARGNAPPQVLITATAAPVAPSALTSTPLCWQHTSEAPGLLLRRLQALLQHVQFLPPSNVEMA